MIEKQPFGRTGHQSTRILFGAAALGGMRQDRSDRVLETVREYGLNHIDTAASYGDSELRLAPFLQDYRSDYFLATKTGERTGDGAYAQLQRSLERLGVDHVDLIQLHNLVDEEGWQTAHAPGGAVEALARAREEGLTRFIGVTGHGTQVAAMHVRSLERFPFDSVLVPYNFSMMSQADYAADFERLEALCHERGVAIQTIKSIARRRWREDDPDKRFSWYMPIREPEGLRRAVHYVLRRPGLFLNSSSDATLLRPILEAAQEKPQADVEELLRGDVRSLGIEPLFVRGVSDTI